jgi:hypothetical protein
MVGASVRFTSFTTLGGEGVGDAGGFKSWYLCKNLHKRNQIVSTLHFINSNEALGYTLIWPYNV